ncbi:MAG: hypothetical protein LBQ99_03775 [Endomicrobium sp.]|nr:hypothetical protein [Endomicrobium sp.]
MSLYNLKKIQISSVIRIFPIIFTLSGIILGAILFLFNSFTTSLDFNVRLLSSLSFTLIYTVFMTLSGIVILWVYNFVAEKLNCNIIISLDLESIDDSVVDSYDVKE